MAKVKKRKPAKVKKSRPVSKRKKRVVKKRIAVKAKRRPPTKKRKRAKRSIIRQVQRTSVVRVVGAAKKKMRRRRKRRVVMAGTRNRSVGRKGGSGLVIGLGIGLLAFYLLSKKSTTTYPNYPQLPPLTQTPNYQRNDQTNAIVNYALAAGLAINAISSLIEKLNNSDDTSVKNIYDHVETTGTIPDYVYV